MKILLVCMQHDYGDPSRGYSYDYYNFYQSLLSAGCDVELFDYMGAFHAHGRDAMNAALLKRIEDSRPAVAVFSLYTDQILPETVKAARALTKTLCFFHDDTWRRDFARFWAPHFDYFTSSDFEGRRKYERLGMRHFIHFPFGANEHLYRPVETARTIDVSFVGGWHPYREWLIRRLRRAGVSVETAGYRWPSGLVAHEKMVQIFSQSRINLNLSNSCSWDMRYLLTSPRGIVNSLRTPKSSEQIKARHFEISACKAFQLSYYVDGLERCYRIGEELAVFLDPDDLVDKVRYYLADDDLRERMAAAAYQRTLVEHTYARRFAGVFDQMGVLAAGHAGEGEHG